jgi:transposase
LYFTSELIGIGHLKIVVRCVLLRGNRGQRVFSMSGKRYTDEFKIEAVKQVTDRGHKISEVASRLGVTPKSLHDWVKKYGDEGTQYQALSEQQAEMRQLKAELRRVTEERDILKEAAEGSTGHCNSYPTILIFSRPSHETNIFTARERPGF